MTDLSPKALSVWCRFCEVVENHGPPRLGLAAALRVAADNWKSEIFGQSSTEFIQGINNCIAALQEIAAELEGHQ